MHCCARRSDVPFFVLPLVLRVDQSHIEYPHFFVCFRTMPGVRAALKSVRGAARRRVKKQARLLHQGDTDDLYASHRTDYCGKRLRNFLLSKYCAGMFHATDVATIAHWAHHAGVPHLQEPHMRVHNRTCCSSLVSVHNRIRVVLRLCLDVLAWSFVFLFPHICAPPVAPARIWPCHRTSQGSTRMRPGR